MTDIDHWEHPGCSFEQWLEKEYGGITEYDRQNLTLMFQLRDDYDNWVTENF